MRSSWKATCTRQECEQGVRAFDIAAEMVRRMEEKAEKWRGCRNRRRYDRYMRSDLDEVSDPGYWHDIRATWKWNIQVTENKNQMRWRPIQRCSRRRNIDTCCEKHEVSDEELWLEVRSSWKSKPLLCLLPYPGSQKIAKFGLALISRWEKFESKSMFS